MTPQEREQLDRLVAALKPECEIIVRQITGQPCLTKDRYDQYMVAIDRLAQGKRTMGTIMAIALIRAGANKDGVLAAHKILYGG